MVTKRAFLYGCVGCACGLGSGALLARDGVEVNKESSVFASLVPAAEVEQSARQQYSDMMKEAASKNALGPDNHPQVMRLRRIAKELIPHSFEWNPRAKEWTWEVNLVGSNQINAFCMPGGKIAFYSGILTQLQLTDDEVAMVMGHEIAHALREHARERMGKAAATNGVATIGSTVASVFLASAHSSLIWWPNKAPTCSTSSSAEMTKPKRIWWGWKSRPVPATTRARV